FLESLSSSRILALWITLAPIALGAVVLATAAGIALVLRIGSRRPLLLSLALGVLAGGAYGIGLRRAHGTPSLYDGAIESAAPVKKPPRSLPNILWIAVDSLRPDKIDPDHTPHIAQLLTDSVYFPNGIVTVPRTGPSWTSALTGLSPLTTGVETMFPRTELGAL